MILNYNDESLSLITASAVTTDYNVAFGDTPGTNVEAHQSNEGNITTATTTTIVAAPGPRVARKIFSVQVRNKHASSVQSVTLAKTVNGTAYHLTPVVTLNAGEALIFSRELGLQVFDSTGRVKTTGISSKSPAIMMSPSFALVNHSDTRTIGPGWSQGVYVGKAPRNLESITARLRVTTAASVGDATEWCEVAVAKGSPVAGAAPTLTVVGFTSAESALASVGMHNVIVSVSPLYGLNEGDDVWILVGSSAGTNPIVRAQAHDIIQTGGHVIVSSRPSSILGTATAFTLAAVSVSNPWLAGIV